jgi:catechol 2,3-dioxygenase-like lactoylglutathione lyase family enzyme
MITDIDHLVLLCPSIEEGRVAYETLFGRNADWMTIGSEGISSVFFQLDGIALELIAPVGDSELAARLKRRLREQGPGLQSIVFASDSLAEDRRVFERRALKPSEAQTGQSTDALTARTRQWSRFRIPDDVTGGVRIFVLQRAESDLLTVKPAAENSLLSLDHLVISTNHPDRATAFFGARLGLRLSLDISSAERDMRLISFRVASSRIELSHRISKAGEANADKLWGVTWKTNDIGAAHSRMQKAGLNVSEVRTGMTKGTQVFSVRDGTLNIPTLILCNDR